MSEAMEREGSGKGKFPEQGLRAGAVPAAGRAREDGAVGRGHRREDRRDLRRPRRRRQGRRDPTDHRAHEPAHHEARRPAEAVRPRAHAVVLPALRRRAAGGRRDRAVRPQLVQPRRRRAGARVLHAGRVLPLPAPDADLRAAARGGRHHPDQVLVLGERRGAGATVRQAHRRSAAPLEALARPTCTRARSGSTTHEPRTRCSCTPTSPRRRGTWSTPTTRRGRASTASRTCCRWCPTRSGRFPRSSSPTASATRATCARRATSTPTCPTTPTLCAGHRRERHVSS